MWKSSEHSGKEPLTGASSSRRGNEAALQVQRIAKQHGAALQPHPVRSQRRRRQVEHPPPRRRFGRRIQRAREPQARRRVLPHLFVGPPPLLFLALLNHRIGLLSPSVLIPHPSRRSSPNGSSVAPDRHPRRSRCHPPHPHRDQSECPSARRLCRGRRYRGFPVRP